MPSVGNKRGGKARNDARSRNTTPISSTSNDQTSLVNEPLTMSYADLLKEYGTLASPPPVGQLKKIMEALNYFSSNAKEASSTCDMGMRAMAQMRRETSETIRVNEMAKKQAEEDRKQKELKKNKLKKEQEEAEAQQKPLTTGAHALAPQDGSSVDDSATVAAQAAAPEPIPEAQPQDRRISHDTNASETEKPRPEPALPAFQTFGPDPSIFDDPTIYHIRDWTPDDDEEEIKDILGVSDYPQSDLHELTCGTPPDRNLENAKPQNQVTYNQFSTYLEQFTKSLTEEDLAFLMERVGVMSHAVSHQQANQAQGDRVSPFVIPRRGPRHYKEIWAEEDAGLFGDAPMTVDEPQSTIEASGSLEEMTDEMAETSNISLGPMASRLLSMLRPIHRPDAPADAQNSTATPVDADGDIKMEQTTSNDGPSTLKPATYFPESSLPGFKTDFPKLSAAEIDERLKATLKHIGFLDADAEPDYEGHHDDEVAARLRYLQEELQRVNIINGARKARIRELVEYHYAQQEWLTIADDLDSQLNQAYLKRHRNMGKGKAKPKRPGQVVAAGAASGVKSLGDSTRAIMQRRNDWRNMIGPVVDFGESRLPQESVFSEEVMKDLMQKEKEEFQAGGGRV